MTTTDKQKTLMQDLSWLSMMGGPTYLMVFRAMYSRIYNLEATINDIISEMDDRLLDNALRQVKNSIDKLHRNS